PVLVGARQQPGVVAALAVPAGEHIRRHLRVRVPDVGHVIDIEDGCGDIEGLAGRHEVNPKRQHRQRAASAPSYRSRLLRPVASATSAAASLSLVPDATSASTCATPSSIDAATGAAPSMTTT